MVKYSRKISVLIVIAMILTMVTPFYGETDVKANTVDRGIDDFEMYYGGHSIFYAYNNKLYGISSRVEKEVLGIETSTNFIHGTPVEVISDLSDIVKIEVSSQREYDDFLIYLDKDGKLYAIFPFLFY